MLTLIAVVGLNWWSHGDSPRSVVNQPDEKNDAFKFVRVRYDSTGGFGESWYTHEGRDWQRWETDFPQAEKNLILRLKELTSMRVDPDPIVLRLTDPRIYDHPFLFMSDVGWQYLSNAETNALTRYLETGGFLWVDDFWGVGEWNNFYRNVGKLRSDWKWQPIPKGHPIFTIVYPLEECPQVPARIFYAQSGLEFDPPGVHRYPSGGYEGVRDVHFMGLFDRNDRLLAVATHNTDIADGWEREGESLDFFERFSIRSYAITINILFYAMTH